MTQADDILLAEVTDLVRQVGSYQLSRFRSQPPGGGDEKEAREFVSEVDINSEQRLKETLHNLLPEAGFLCEESGTSGAASLRWIIDPLDGTTNFLSGIEQFSISVALEKDGKTQLGVIYRPASAECFAARRGGGLSRNGKRCPTVTDPPLQQALIGTGFPFRSPDLSTQFFACAQEVLYRCRGLRRFGSAALDLSYVAAGFFQGFWESDLQPYDVAAALLFMEETGCRISNQQGAPYSPYKDRILVCGSASVHHDLLSSVGRHYKS